MSDNSRAISIGETPQKVSEQTVQGEYVTILGDKFYKIQNFDAMEPFFMSIVSSSNHWLFISSTGGLSAGRISAEQSLFPYYTEDKLTENSENTGSKAIFLVTRANRTSLWEPFSIRQQGVYQSDRNIYKNVIGTAVIFEEINYSLGLTYRYGWRTSDDFGFVKTSWMQNRADSPCTIELVDGLQNIMPSNITSLTQNTFSPLLDAYKRSELQPDTGLGIFALNSTLTDLAEPSESLLATTVVQLGLDNVDYLLSSAQLDDFRNGKGITVETDVRGRRCAYFVHTSLDFAPGIDHSWHLVAEVCQDSSAIVRLANRLKENRADLVKALEGDILANNANLEKIVASADGLQVSQDQLRCANHFANVMFNEMRGGFFGDQYLVHKQDFIEFLSVRNPAVILDNASFFSKLPEEISFPALQTLCEETGSADLIRLSHCYLPLSFSRRHGDPSRPWNRFEINIKKEDGTQQLGYEGNWRDIFQNWEALAYSYPEYVESMICTFLNATTLDGYNPYRITREGIEWEIPEPGNPWANIGYWGDHQIIYLQKLMEVSVRVHPGKLQEFLSKAMFSYSNVPYRIKPYTDLQVDPFNSIVFDWDLEREIERRVKERGTDGKLISTTSGKIITANLTEKLLTLLLAKIVNFVPEGGIWMNTQRPEWNDANNALVGKGLSVVTLCYLRRTVKFYKQLLEQSPLSSVQISREVQDLFSQISQILARFQSGIGNSFSDQPQRNLMDALGQAGSEYREICYSNGFSGEMTPLLTRDLVGFLDLVLKYVDHSLRANKRGDNLYHAYNILHLGPQTASISHLYEMLEGQVAILSSGLLSGEESLMLLESMRQGKLYRADQHSYILYPDRDLPGFLEKNCISLEKVKSLALIMELVKAHDVSLITRDDDGNYHFNAQFRNVKDVRRSLEALKLKPQFEELVNAEAIQIEALFEDIFNHDEFTGRSSTFFAYEGLGSIYWHMVSKLILAVQETILRTRNEPSNGRLQKVYAELCKGQCFNKNSCRIWCFPNGPIFTYAERTRSQATWHDRYGQRRNPNPPKGTWIFHRKWKPGV